MAYRHGILLMLLATVPALADDARFPGHAIETDGASDARQVLRARRALYAIPGTPAQIVRKAQVCLAGPDSHAGIVSVDAEGGRLVAISRVEFRDAERVGLAKGRLAVEAGEGLRVGFVELAAEAGLVAEEAGLGEGEEAPEVGEAVFDGRAGEDEAVFGA